MQIEEILIAKYGPILSVRELSNILKRSAEGLRVQLLIDSDWSRPINNARFKNGRRVYFRTVEIAQILSAEKQS